MEDVSVIKKAAEMNAEHLLTHFDRIADTPDAIPRLRRFILDLAVRGKLVPQDPNDEPVAELLKRIRVEKARLVKAGEIRNPKQVLVIDAGECFFSPPRGWEWKRLSEISRKIHYGFTASANKMADAVRLLRITDIQDNSVDWFSVPGCEIGEKALLQFKLEKGDILVARTGGTIGKSFLVQDVPVAVVFASYLIRVQGSHEIYDRYLKLFLESPIYWIQLHDGSRGAGQPNVNGQTLGKMLVPLPPFAEQHRIVAKVDELMTLCDRLEAARVEREATRDRMATASLARLKTPDPDPATFQNHATFALNNLTPLTTRRDQIKALRQTILNLAVRGKLVPQNPNDEPASERLKRIAADRVALEKNGSIKKSKPLPPVNAADAPFDLPLGWAWARFPEVGLFGRGKSKHRPRNDPMLYTDGKYPFIQTGDVARSGGSIKTYSNFYNDVGLAQSAMWPAGTLCITIAANIADSGILSFDACFPDSIVGLIAYDSFEGAHYFEYFIRTAKANLHDFAPSTAQKNINLGILMEVLIPLPPLSEQHRIVARVNELMTLYDQLETSLTTGNDTRRRLLDALLHEALEHL